MVVISLAKVIQINKLYILQVIQGLVNCITKDQVQQVMLQPHQEVILYLTHHQIMGCGILWHRIQ